MTKAPRRSDRGISMVVVVILVLVTIVLVFTSVLLLAHLNDLEGYQKRLKKEVAAENDREKLIAAGVEADLLPIGPIITKEDLTGDYSGKSKAEVSTRRDKIFAYDGKDPMDAKVKTVSEESGMYSTLEDLIVAQAATLAHLQALYEHAKLDVDIAKVHAESRKASESEVTTPKRLYKERLSAMITEVQGKIQAEEAEYTRRKTELTTARDTANSSLDEARSTFIQFEIKEKNKIGDLRRRLNEMKVKEVINHEISISHGRIIRPDAERKTAFINIGSRERVVPGLHFKVARVGKEGKFEYKGDVLVKKVWMDTAEVAITKNFEGMLPIIDGDLIVNPFFSTKRPVVVAFVGHTGERSIRLRFAAREAANRIAEIGSEARMSLSLDADFVLFTEGTGEKPTPELWEDYRKAVQLEIPLAKQASEYYQFLGE